MSWIAWTIIGHLANAAAFIIDKSLLTTAFKKSGTYAAAIGMLSLAVAVAIPWVEVWPAWDVWPATIAFGVVFVAALWAFFEAMRVGEASRVVPIVGSLIPLATLVLGVWLLQEQFSVRVLAGVGCLLVATALLAGGSGAGRLPTRAVGMSLVAATLFASSSVAGKYAFNLAPFLGVFVGSRLAAGVSGLLLFLCVPGIREELQARDSAHAPKKAGTLLFVGQALGAVGFLLVQLGLRDGSPTIVNALQAVQYAAIVLVAWIGGSRLRALLKEEVSRAVLLRKGAALALVAIGLALVAETVTV